jgi:exonuclease SbcD
MESLSFLHAADLHLGSAFQGIHKTNKDVANALRESTYKAFDSIVDHAVHNQVDFVLFAGDIYNQSENNLQPQLRFREGLEKLHDAQISTCLIHGNHDPLDGKDRNFKWPDSCHRFPAGPTDPHLIYREGDELAAVSGISYGRRSVADNLARRYRHKHDHLFSIGLLHANCGALSGHDNYAPCTLEELKSFKFDYWALGHIHKHAVLHPANPTVIYSGSPQGLNPKETGVHGCYQVSVDENRFVTPQFIPTAGIVWHQDRVDASGWQNEEDAVSALEGRIAALGQQFEGKSVVVRLNIQGRTAMHRWLNNPSHLQDLTRHLRSLIADDPFVWTEGLRVETRPDIDFEERRQGQDLVGEVLRQADEFALSEAGLEAARKQLESLFTHSRARRLLEASNQPHTEAQIRDLISRASTLAVDYLVGNGEA